MTTPRPEQAVREDITRTLHSELPQIKMHGGEAEIVTLNVDDGHAEIALGGYCTGCGLSPMTIKALQKRLVKHIPELTTVDAHTGVDGHSGTPRGNTEDAPF